MVQSASKKDVTVCYIRVSTLEQAADGESRRRQEEQTKAYCSRCGFKNPVVLVDDGVSGFKDNRPAFQKLLRLCKSGVVDTVVVYDLSRLSRSVRTTLAVVEDVFHRGGINFVSLQNDIDTTTPMGKAFLTFIALFNQLYRDEISHRTRLALDHKRSKGEKLGGHVPFGFAVRNGHMLVELAEEIMAIQMIQRLRTAGLSLRAIAQRLSERGIKTKTGKTNWSPAVVRGLLLRHRPLNLNDAVRDGLVVGDRAIEYRENAPKGRTPDGDDGTGGGP